MRSQTTVLGSAIVLSMLLAACNKPASEPAPVPADAAVTTDAANPADAASAAVDPTASAPATSTNGLMTATPATATCGSGSDVTFNWNVNTPDVANIEIWVGDTGSDARLFATGGLTGSQATGPWVVPGTVFVMRNQANSAEIDRLVVGGPECTPAATP